MNLQFYLALGLADQVIETTVGSTYALDISIDINDRTILADEPLLEGDGIRFSAPDALDFGVSLVKIIRVRNFLPIHGLHLFARVADNRARQIVETDEAAGFGRHDGHADKRQIEKVVTENPYELFDLKKYYTSCINYILDQNKIEALDMFLQKIKAPYKSAI